MTGIDWERFDARACVATVITRCGLAERGVAVGPEVLLVLDTVDGQMVVIHCQSLDRVREMLPLFSPSRLRYCGARHEAAELQGLASAINSAAQYVREIERGLLPAP